MLAAALLLLPLAAEVPRDAVIHAVAAGGEVSVRITIGKRRSLDVDGAARILLEGTTLVVEAPLRAGGKPPQVTLVVDQLDLVSAGIGATHVEVTGVRGKALTVSADGAAVVSVAGTVGKLAVRGGGSAQIDTRHLAAHDVDVSLKNAARADVLVADHGSLRCDLRRASRLRVRGKPAHVDKKVAGVARLILE